jgi:hypothetical protein
MMVFRGWAEGKGRNMGIKFQFEKMKRIKGMDGGNGYKKV